MKISRRKFLFGLGGTLILSGLGSGVLGYWRITHLLRRDLLLDIVGKSEKQLSREILSKYPQIWSYEILRSPASHMDDQSFANHIREKIKSDYTDGNVIQIKSGWQLAKTEAELIAFAAYLERKRGHQRK